MFEGLEKGWTENKRTAWDKALFALNLLMMGYLAFILIFEPGVLTQPHNHGIWRLIYWLVPVGFGVTSIANLRRAKRQGSKLTR